MTNFNEPTNVADLIGLWDFVSGNENADTGLDDGIAQDGNAVDGNGVTPSFSNDQLHVGAGSNSNPTVFDVNADINTSADDEQFNLDRGTLEVQFTQSSHSGGSEDVILSRGEKQIDEDDEGFFEIRVTDDGSVQSYHNTDNGDHEATLSTSDGFFSPGDVINVKYSFDVATGARLTVENLTTGETESLVSTETGLTFDITDNDDEEFTFGAREDDDGDYDKEFQGSIDYVALYSTTNDPVTNPNPSPSDPDYIVEGTSAGELIDTAYTGDPEGDMVDTLDDGGTPASNDDVVQAGGGNDTVNAGDGDDTVYGGTGNDLVFGDDDDSQAGDDLLLGEEGDDTLCGLDGDDTLDGGAGDDLLEGMEGADLLLGGSGDDRAYGANGDDTIFGDQSQSSTMVGDNLITNGSFEIGQADNSFGQGTNQPGWYNPNGDLETWGQGFQGEVADEGNNFVELDVESGVDSVAQNVDTDAGQDYQLTFSLQQRIEGSGDTVEVYFGGQLVDTIVPGDDWNEYSYDVTGTGSDVLEFREPAGQNNTYGPLIDNVSMFALSDDEGDGNDTLIGGAGEDLIYGNGGDDSIQGNSGDDTLYGDDPQAGTVVSGNLIFNGSFEITSGMTTTGFGFRGEEDDGVPGWTDANGNEIDFHNDGRGGVNPTDGDNWLDLESSPGNARVGQVVDGVQDDETYKLSFDAGDKADEPQSGADENLIEVYWGGELIATIDPEAGQMDEYTFEVIGGAGDGSNKLEFVGLGAEDNFGASIDNVSLVQLAGEPGEGGNDTITGGAGEDEIYGQGGDDTFIVSSAADGAGDVIDGGNGPDETTDNDVLDLRGAGLVTIDDAADANDDGATTGTVTFADGTTLSFEGIETILSDNPVNTAPEGDDDGFTVSEDQDPAASVGNVLGNDTDAEDAGLLEVSEVGGDAAGVGTPVAGSDGGLITIAEDGSVTFDPNGEFDALAPGDTATTTVEYTVTDPSGLEDTATVTFTVTGVNDDPDAMDDSNTTDFETAVEINLLANDSDVDNASSDLTVTSATVPAAEGTLTPTGTEGVYSFEPATGFEGTATVSYTISDGAGGTDAGTHTVEVGADPIPQDGIVDGEATGELMELGYDDANLPTDNGGDLITDGDDEIEGNGGNDTIDGAGGDDTIDGGTGDDVIAGGDGTNELTGGRGDDTFVGGDGADSFQGGPGQDNIDYSDSDAAVNVDLSTSTASGGDADNDTIGLGIEGVIGSEFDDTLIGGDAIGTSPADTFTSELFGEGGNDTIYGNGGGDLLDGGNDDDLVDGGDGDDTITGGDGSDVLVGGEGSDMIDGGNDDDDIVVGAGDTATGGSGDDVFTVDPSLTGTDPITVIGGETGEDLTDPTNGGEGDTLDLRGLDLVSLVYEATDPEAGTAIYNNDAGDPVTITFSEIEIVLHDPLPDGVVDGEETGEDMQPTYDDGEQATDNGGDVIDGPDGDDDTINGNGGDDTINAGQGSDTVSGGTGNDSIIGGASDDGDDLSGDEGDDTLKGGGGDDTIDGGIGDDSIEGGTGDDDITGGDGNDDVVGGTGNDTIDTSGSAPATDLPTPTIPGLLVGGPGDVDPDDDKDTVDGGAGDDLITTGDDADVITGGTGNDTIDGGIDADTIDGGADDDLIVGGEGSDSILGGGGEDTIYGGLDPSFPDVLNVADDGFNSPIGNDPVLDNGDDFINGGAGNDLIFGQDDNDTILGGTGDDTIDGGVDDDSILGGQGEDSIEGGHGQDFIQGNNDNDMISGGRGSDTLEGNAGDDTIIGGAGDSIIGGGGADSIFIDQDEVDENGDNDASIFVEGNNFGDDNDTLNLTDFVAYRNLVETDDGDVANPSTSGTVEVQNDEGEWVPVAFNEIENLLLPVKAPDLVVDGEETGELMNPLYDDAGQATDGGGDIIDGADGDNDSIRGNGGDDTINAGEGDDTVDGGADNDSIRGGNGDDDITGGDGDDTVRGEVGNDTVDGGDGNDSVTGGIGDDSLTGGEGDDSLTGGSGDDTIDGGIGNDSITGSTGNDSITDLDGDNLINSDNPGSFNPDLGTPIAFADGTSLVLAPDTDPDDNKDTITTGDGNDTINSGDDADLIDAGNGDNVIDGGTDKDTITTGTGNDEIIGGEGSDLINSGDGNDTITGGVGDPIANYIDNPNGVFAADPILDNGDDTIFAGAGDDVVMGEDDNDLIDGGTGDDTLDGGIDDDTILGGAGDDVIIGGQGADSLDGGEGDDTFNVGAFTDPNGSGDYVEGLGDTVVGGEDPSDDDIDVLDLTGSVDFDILYEDSIDPTGTSGESGKVVYYTDDTKSVIKGELVFKEIENVIPCFTPGTMIATPRGEVPVETLREGDKVITRDNGIQEIRWTGNRTLNREELAEGDNLKPIMIKAGSLGRNLPERDMLVSPQHRVLITGETPQLYFEESEVLVAAKHLVGKSGVSIMDTMRTTYIHFMFDRHEVVLSDGAWTESFQPGDQTLGSMGEASRDEIFALFPELMTEGGLTDYAAARRSLKAHEAKLLQL